MSQPERDPESRRRFYRHAAAVLAVEYLLLSRAAGRSPWLDLPIAVVAVPLVWRLNKARDASATGRGADRPARLNPLWDRELDRPE